MSTALKHAQLEVERRSGHHQRYYEHKLSNTLKQLGNESAVGEATGSDRKLRHLEEEFGSRDNRDLRRLRDLLSITPKHRTADGRTYAIPGAAAAAASASVDPAQTPSAASSRTPSLLGLHAVQALHERITGLHRMKGRQASPATTTTVTREKNKLIIKQQPLQPDVKENKRRQR